MMMGNGMPNSHSKIPLPMLIRSHCYGDNREKKRFGGRSGSGISADTDDTIERAEALGSTCLHVENNGDGVDRQRKRIGCLWRRSAFDQLDNATIL
jgi:hypothetical protein